MADVEILAVKIQERFAEAISNVTIAFGELTVELPPENLSTICRALLDEANFKFELLVDIAGVDYLQYGISEWVTEKATNTGFERAVDDSETLRVIPWNKPRFAVVYHLLSVTHNHRVRLRAFVEGDPPFIASVVNIWPSANWYERETFDLYGIVFEGHPDLRRLLTDYGFIGHPFRKDFPLSGNVEVRYDATSQRVIYEPVDIVPRILVPKVIRAAKKEKGEIKNA